MFFRLLQIFFIFFLICGFSGNTKICFGDILKNNSEQHREPTVSKKEADILSQVSYLSKNDLEKALDYLRPKIKIDSSPALYFAAGNLYFQLNRLPEAETAYRTALEKMPAFDRARANLARILIQQEKTDAAIKELQHILLQGSQNPSIITLIGYTYLLRDQPIPAESAYRKALLLRPDDINAYLGLAKALLLQDRFREAAKILETVLLDYPQRGELWALLANVRLALEQSRQAIVALETARRLGVASDEALMTLGDLYLNQGQYHEALVVYEKAFATDHLEISRLLRAIEGFLMFKELDPAERLLRKARLLEKEKKFSPQNRAQLRWLEAKQAHLSGKLRTALKAYRRLLQTEPLNGKVLMALGELYQITGEPDRAIITFERAARLPDVRVEALIKHAQVEVERENYRKAIELLVAAQSL